MREKTLKTFNENIRKNNHNKLLNYGNSLTTSIKDLKLSCKRVRKNTKLTGS